MSLALIFLLVLIVCFGLVLLLTRASKTEMAIRRGLASLSEEYRAKPLVSTILKQERLSQVLWVDDLLAKLPFSWRLLDLIKQAGSHWQVSTLVSYSLVAAFTGAIVATIVGEGVVTIAVMAIAAGLLPAGYLLLLRYRKLQASDALLPRAVELMSRALRAGLTINSSLELAGRDVPDPLGTEFRIVHEEQALGLPLRDALMNLLKRMPGDDMRFLTTALLLQKETGGNLVQILETVGRVMRERARIRGQVRIYTAQARVSGWIVAVIPFLMYGLISFMNPQYEKLLFDDSIGRTIFYFGAVMWIIGIFLIKRIVSIKI